MSPLLVHEAEMPKYLGDVRCWVNSGSHLLALSISEFDPSATFATLNCRPAVWPLNPISTIATFWF